MSQPDTPRYPPIAPSGGQLHLRAGTDGPPLVAVTLGGGLREGPGLEGYAEDELPAGGRGQVLAPWPNRLRNGHYAWAGVEHQLPLSEPATSTAIHGLVRWAEWQVTAGPEGTEGRGAVLEHVLAPQPGYPFRLLLVAAYTALADGFTTTLSATNLAAVPAPFGAGQHPYLSAGTALVDDVELTVAAGTVLTTDDRGLPTGEQSVHGYAGRVGDARLDATYGALARGTDGRATVVLTGPERTVTLWADEAWRWLQVFTGDTLAPDRRRRGLAVEPLSCPPDALASGRDLVVLEPGETWTGQWGVTVA